jgi:hypothetical protein
MKSQLLSLLHAFNCDAITIEQFRRALLSLIKQGMEQDLTDVERKKFRGLFANWIDMYDSKLQPRSGIVGRFLDICDQIFHSNYRISVVQVRERTREFESFLTRKSECN